MKIVQKSNPLDKKRDSPGGRIRKIPIEPGIFMAQKQHFSPKLRQKQ